MGAHEKDTFPGPWAEDPYLVLGQSHPVALMQTSLAASGWTHTTAAAKASIRSLLLHQGRAGHLESWWRPGQLCGIGSGASSWPAFTSSTSSMLLRVKPLFLICLCSSLPRVLLCWGINQEHWALQVTSDSAGPVIHHLHASLGIESDSCSFCPQLLTWA